MTRSVPMIVTATALAALTSVGWAAAAGAAPTKTVTANVIRDGGAESAHPNDSLKVAVPSWVVGATSNFTAVSYGSSGGFPTASSPGPKSRGHDFFAGGPSGDTSSGRQVDSLAADRKLISAGKASYNLSGWLGGYSTQTDRATLSITWETSTGTALKTASIGPVTEAQRAGVTGMLFRSVSGAVPKGATQVLVVLRMIRDDGEYIDGYADNLGLAILRS